jgi:hypothetical protein
MTEIDLSEGPIEAIAMRVVELLESRPTGPALVDAAELARGLGVTRAWVYEHATKLGAVRLGSGPAPRLRFDPAKVAAILEPDEPQPPPTKPARRRGRPRRPLDKPVPLLPIAPRI